MTDTATNEKTREAVAIRDWIDAQGNPVETGSEKNAIGLRYIHLPSARKLDPKYNPETDAAHADAVFEVSNIPEPAKTMLAIFGGLTLAGNVVNTATKGPKGDPNINPIALIADRFKEIIDNETWTDRAAGLGGVRYDKEKLAAAIADAKGETDPAPYLLKLENKVDPKSGAVIAADTKGAISYGAYALRNAAVKAAYDKLTGGGVQLEAL